ncbi:MAG TPA: class I SAM-dependent methyltransferase [Vicinamibacterales bacterium]|nr:class I SAM-dependent methyltransferase [Vicinamibacterales bacterium]
MRVRIMACAMLMLSLCLTVPAMAQQGQKQPLREPDVIFVPTPAEVVTAMLKLANVTSKDVVYDLGCGDGMIVTAAAKEFGAKAVGIDINPVRVKEANERVQKAGVTDKVTILNEDLFEAKISDATVVTLYLLQTLNQKLIPKLNKELKPGTRIVSQTFSMGDNYPPEKTIDVAGRPIYLWTVPMKEKK